MRKGSHVLKLLSWNGSCVCCQRDFAVRAAEHQRVGLTCPWCLRKSVILWVLRESPE